MEKIILTNENCFDFLPKIKANSINLVVIDPPYGISRSANFNSGEAKGTDTDRFRVSLDFGEWDKNFTGLDTVINECYRVLRNGGTLICFYDVWKITELKQYLENSNFKQLRLLEWVKTNPVPRNSKKNYLTNAKEYAIGAVKGKNPVFNSKMDNGIYYYPTYGKKDRIHPTQKPVLLIEELIKKHSNPQDTVLDCFSGSGTTALASFNLGRNFIGCELDQNYYDDSISRLKSNGINISTVYTS